MHAEKIASNREQKGNHEGKGRGGCLNMVFVVHGSTQRNFLAPPRRHKVFLRRKGVLLPHHAIRDPKASCILCVLEIRVELEQVCNLRFLYVSWKKAGTQKDGRREQNLGL